MTNKQPLRGLADTQDSTSDTSQNMARVHQKWEWV